MNRKEELVKKKIIISYLTLINLKNKWKSKVEQNYINKVSKELKHLWKKQGIRPNDVLREKVKDILLHR